MQDAKPANEHAEQALSLRDEAKNIHRELDALGTGVRDRCARVNREPRRCVRYPLVCGEFLGGAATLPLGLGSHYEYFRNGSSFASEPSVCSISFSSSALKKSR